MSLATITLPTNKSISTVSDHVRTIGQGERGQKLNVIVTNADGSAYNLQGCRLTFSENKEGGKIVSDNESTHFMVTDDTGGQFTYLLAPQVYAASGVAWFDITANDGSVIDTTKTFNINVIEDETIQINNDNYVSDLMALETHYEAVIQKSKQDTDSLVTNLTDAMNKAVADNNQKVADMISSAKTSVQNAVDSLNTTESNMKTEIEQAKADAISKANTDFSNKLSSIQSDYDQWKQTAVSDLSSRLSSIESSLSTDEQTQSSLKSDIDSAKDAISKIQNVDFTKYVLKTDLQNNYYDKTTVDNKLANAGKLKTVSINGGTKVGADTTGNADLTVAQPDMSQYETKADAQTIVQTVSGKASQSDLTTLQEKVTSNTSDLTTMKADVKSIKDQLAGGDVALIKEFTEHQVQDALDYSNSDKAGSNVHHIGIIDD